jgi:anti-sigma regulatory factor (Ser/Thr protein kinase)
MSITGSGAHPDRKHMVAELPCSKKSFMRARMKIKKFATENGFADESEDIVLAVDEAMKNIMQHACPADGMMHITVETNSETLAVDVMDTGAGFDIETLEKQPSEPLGMHGRGMQLIRGLMDDVSIVSDQEGTVVHMEKRRAT